MKDFDFSLVVYEKVLVRNDSGGLYHQDAYSQVANNVQRTMRVKKSINIEEIFDKRRKYEQGPLEEIRTVLAIGNPGTGQDFIYLEQSYLVVACRKDVFEQASLL